MNPLEKFLTGFDEFQLSLKESWVSFYSQYQSEIERFVGTLDWLSESYFNDFVIFSSFYLILGNTIYLVILILGYINSKKKFQDSFLSPLDIKKAPELLKPISILVPAYNEEKSIVDSVRTLCQLNYPIHEVIVVNDGSSDGTLKALLEGFDFN